MRTRSGLALLAAAVLAACSSHGDSTGITIRADGGWRADSLSGTSWIKPGLSLTETDAGAITGELVVNHRDSSHLFFIDVTGKQRGSDVTLDWTLDGNWEFKGTVTAASLDGTVSNGQATYPQTFTRP